MNPRYTYSPKNGCWVVYKWHYNGNTAVGEKVAEYATKQEAKDETYRLNGWKIKP